MIWFFKELLEWWDMMWPPIAFALIFIGFILFNDWMNNKYD